MAEVHGKGWGLEIWYANSPDYCLKKLFVVAGKRCSVHYHEEKRETFVLQSGLIKLLWAPPEEFDIVDHSPDRFFRHARELMMTPGSSFDIPQRMLHQFIGLEDSWLIEASTQHKESDSYRLIKGD